MARGLGLILALAFAAPAQAAPVYPLYGLGTEPPRSGVPAAELDISGMPIPVAARADGVVAFATEGEVYWVRGGRAVRVPVPAYEGIDLAFAPDGDLLVSACPSDRRWQTAGVFRASPDHPPVLIAGRPHASASAGDGGPAVAASFTCPTGIDVAPDGGILVADGATAGTVRRIGTDGVIRAIAGARGQWRPAAGADADSGAAPGDGGPALQAALPRLGSVVALPGGAFAVLDGGRIRVVDPGGTIRSLSSVPVAALDADGNALLALARDGALWRLGLDGSATRIVLEPAGITPFIPLAGDPFGLDETIVGDVAAVPDGGVLLSSDFAVRYLPPADPWLQAVALLPSTRVRGDTLTVTVKTTRPAKLQVGIWRGGHRVASVTAAVPGGEAAVPIPGPLTPGAYRVHVQAAGPGGIAAASASVFVGRLPLEYARALLESRLQLFETFLDDRPYRLRCGRRGAWRVDCLMRQKRHCAGVASMRVQPDGSLTLSTRRGCQLRT